MVTIPSRCLVCILLFYPHFCLFAGQKSLFAVPWIQAMEWSATVRLESGWVKTYHNYPKEMNGWIKFNVDMCWFIWSINTKKCTILSITTPLKPTLNFQISLWMDNWLVVWIFFIFPYIGNNHPKWLIFFRGVQTTNQILSGMLYTCNLAVNYGNVQSSIYRVGPPR